MTLYGVCLDKGASRELEDGKIYRLRDIGQWYSVLLTDGNKPLWTGGYYKYRFKIINIIGEED
jgi:hypothetical protein